MLISFSSVCISFISVAHLHLCSDSVCSEYWYLNNESNVKGASSVPSLVDEGRMWTVDDFLWLWPPNGIGQAIHPVLCSIFLLFLPRLISAVRDYMSGILPHMVWP